MVEIQGDPVADASVIAARCGGGAPQDIDIFARTLTDASGGFVLTQDAGAVAPSGCIFLRIEKEGYIPSSWYTGQMNGITIRLQRLRRVTGRVVEVDGGPLSRVEVTYAPHGSATFTNETGFFALNDVGGYLVFKKSGYVQRGVSVPEGHDVDLDVIHIQRTIVVTGASSLVSRISSADVDYDLSWWGPDFVCNPCKEIELQTEQRALEIRLQWTGHTQLRLWVASGYYGKIVSAAARLGESTLTLPVDATASIMYVGVSYPIGAPQPAVAEPVPFELTTVAR